MLLALVFFTLVVYLDATPTGNITQCPSGCRCQLTSSNTQLYVDCGQRRPDVHEKQLSHQLDSMLSADNIVEHLTSLSITNTPLTRVPASVCKLLNLTSLNLDRNNVTELPDNCFTKLTKLVTLSAVRNAITRLQDGLFDGLQSLVNLVMSYNQISFIGLRVLSNSSDLTRLRKVDLSFNRLTSLEPWWYYRCILGNETSPVIVRLNNNEISNFTNKLQFHYRCGMKPLYGLLKLDHNRILHIMDIFHGWNIESNDLNATIHCLSNYDNMTISLVLGQKYVCDCSDYPIYKLGSYFRYQQGSLVIDAMCQISPPELVCKLSDRCPSKCGCVYRPANVTLHVNCSAANLSSLPLDLPPLPKSYVKYKLDFSNNKLLRRLEHRPYFVNSSILDGSNCSFDSIDLAVLKDVAHISLVNFRGNVLETFPRKADTMNISARLLIGNNPWRCSCDNSWMIGWLQSLSRQILDPNDITCASPSRMYTKNVLKSTKEAFCVDMVNRYLITILCLAVAVATVILVVISGIISYKLRLPLYKKWKVHPFDRDECIGEDMDYDVFLCCSSEDHNPHGLRILREMESKGYRVCYHLRDFLAGALVTENMIQAIERSKRTLCLISNNFIQRLILIRYLAKHTYCKSAMIYDQKSVLQYIC